MGWGPRTAGLVAGEKDVVRAGRAESFDSILVERIQRTVKIQLLEVALSLHLRSGARPLPGSGRFEAGDGDGPAGDGGEADLRGSQAGHAVVAEDRPGQLARRVLAPAAARQDGRAVPPHERQTLARVVAAVRGDAALRSTGRGRRGSGALGRARGVPRPQAREGVRQHPLG